MKTLYLFRRILPIDSTWLVNLTPEKWVLLFGFTFYLSAAPVACFGIVVTLSRFLAIWVTLAAVWKIIWHLYSRLIGIFYETRACWKVQQQRSPYKQTNIRALLDSLAAQFPSFPVSSDGSRCPLFSDNDTGTQNQRRKINLMSKTCNKLHWRTNEFYLFHFPPFN